MIPMFSLEFEPKQVKVNGTDITIASTTALSVYGFNWISKNSFENVRGISY